MKQTYKIGAIIIILLIVVAVFFKLSRPVIGPEPTSLITSSTPPQLVTDDIKITSPLLNQEVVTPGKIIINGEVKGNWFFEATFPVRLEDGQGRVIANSQAHATSDWMTTDFVPFKAEIEVSEINNPTSAVIVFSKDNPSGLLQNDANIKLPIRLVGGR